MSAGELHGEAQTRVRVSIKRAVAFRVAKWIEANRAFVETHTHEEVRSAVMAELKIEAISVNSIANICYDLGIKDARGAVADDSRRIARLEALVAYLFKNLDLHEADVP